MKFYRTLSNNEKRVVDYLLSKKCCEKINKRYYVLAKELNVDVSNLRKAILSLSDKGIIKIELKKGYMESFMLSEDWIYKAIEVIKNGNEQL